MNPSSKMSLRLEKLKENIIEENAETYRDVNLIKKIDSPAK